MTGVLHITSAIGGGADRYIRDAAAGTSPRHYLWHAGVGIVEDLARRRFHRLRPGAPRALPHLFARWLDAARIGVLHLHGSDSACRDALAACSQAARPYVVTLHDVSFAQPDAFAAAPASAAAACSPPAEVIAMLRGARQVIVPSPFMRALLARATGIEAMVVEPGIAPATRAFAPPLSAPEHFTNDAHPHVVAIAGAIGPHKGSALLEPIAAALRALQITTVVVGYTEARLRRGYAAPSLFVHGPYPDGMLGAWLAAYGTKLVLFPNRLAESFSYTLSEVWAAGIPAIVPDDGALGERVARHGGGWRLPAQFSADQAIALIARLLLVPDGVRERLRIQSTIVPTDSARIPTHDAMHVALQALYARFAPRAGESAPADAALDPLLAVALEGFAFRGELTKLVSEIAAAEATIAEQRAYIERLQQGVDEGKTWSAKLAADVAELDAGVARCLARCGELEARNAALEGTLADARTSLAAFARLPRPLQRLLRARAKP